eukprot:284818662_3
MDMARAVIDFVFEGIWQSATSTQSTWTITERNVGGNNIMSSYRNIILSRALPVLTKMVSCFSLMNSRTLDHQCQQIPGVIYIRSSVSLPPASLSSRRLIFLFVSSLLQMSQLPSVLCRQLRIFARATLNQHCVSFGRSAYPLVHSHRRLISPVVFPGTKRFAQRLGRARCRSVRRTSAHGPGQLCDARRCSLARVLNWIPDACMSCFTFLPLNILTTTYSFQLYFAELLETQAPQNSGALVQSLLIITSSFRPNC